MPHLNLNWTGMTTPSTCCKVVSVCVMHYHDPHCRHRVGGPVTPRPQTIATRQLQDSRIQFVCVTFYGDWELLILQALSHCNILEDIMKESSLKKNEERSAHFIPML